jgi:hypothetical protein
MIRLGKHHPDFAALQFVSLAVAKDKTHEALMCVNIRDGLAEATDGHRAHQAKLKLEYTAGLYDVIKKTKAEIWLAPSTCDQMFPDVSRVLPVNPQLQELHRSDKHPASTFAQIVRAMSTGTLDYSYLLDVLTSDVTDVAPDDGAGTPIYFEGPTCKAVLMPIKTK